MSIRLGLIYPGAVVLATHTHLPRGVPTAYLLVMAYQQIWPFNPYPGSDDDSLYVAHAELALPLNRHFCWQHLPLSLRMRGTALAGVRCRASFTQVHYWICMSP